MRPVKLTLAGLVVVAAALIATLVYQSGSSLARSLEHTRVPRAQGLAPQAPPRSTPSFDTVPGGELGRATTTDDGDDHGGRSGNSGKGSDDSGHGGDDD